MKLTLTFLLFLCCSSAQAPVVLTGGSVIRNAVIAAVAGGGNDPVFNSLTHYWSLDESSGTRADSKGSINVNQTGGTVVSAAGKNSNAADFQPVSQAGHYLTMASAFPVSPTPFIAFWVNMRTLPASSVVSLIHFPVGNSEFCVVDSSGNVVFEDDKTDGDDGTISQPLGSLNAWHFVVVGSDPNTLLQYISVDGANFTTADATASGAPGFAQLALSFGDPAGSVGNVVPDGKMDEIMVFSTPLSQSDVTTLYGGGTNPKFYRP